MSHAFVELLARPIFSTLRLADCYESCRLSGEFNQDCTFIVGSDALNDGQMDTPSDVGSEGVSTPVASKLLNWTNHANSQLASDRQSDNLICMMLHTYLHRSQMQYQCFELFS